MGESCARPSAFRCLPHRQAVLEMKGSYTIYLIEGPRLKPYVGVTSKSPAKRLRQHKRRARKNEGEYLHNAMRKYGIESFEVVTLDTTNSQKEAYALEMEWIAWLGTYKSGYNMTRGGESGPRMTGENNPMYGLKGKDHPGYATGEDNPMYGRTGQNHPRHGKKHDDKTRQKISEKVGKLSSREASEVKYLALKSNITQREIGKQYAISKSQVCLIKSGRRWSHVDPKKPE